MCSCIPRLSPTCGAITSLPSASPCFLVYENEFSNFSSSLSTSSSACRSVSVCAKNINPRDLCRNFEEEFPRRRTNDNSALAPLSVLPEALPLSPNQALGLVVAQHSNFMRVIVQKVKESENGARDLELLCVVKAVLKKIGRRVMVGDKVLVRSVDWENRRGMIENIFTRKSEILDPPVANVSHLLVLFSMDRPKLEPYSLTRFLVEAESTGISLTLALNKSELVDQETISRWKERIQRWGYDPVICSVEKNQGLDDLGFILNEQTTVVVGPSGVGKSSLINLLRNDEDGTKSFDPTWSGNQRVGEVSCRTGRGKHTTRNVSLLPLIRGGYLADTPGFNLPDLLKVTSRSLAEMFPEIVRAVAPQACAFNDCLHLGERGCVVGTDWDRCPYYLQILDEMKIRTEFQFRTFGTKREGNLRYKTGRMGVEQAEPKLRSRKDLRVSRKRKTQKFLADIYDDDEGFAGSGDDDDDHDARS